MGADGDEYCIGHERRPIRSKNQILASEEEISILGRSSSITKGRQCPYLTLTLLVDYLSRALISTFSAASTYEDPSGAVPDLDAP